MDFFETNMDVLCSTPLPTRIMVRLFIPPYTLSNIAEVIALRATDAKVIAEVDLPIGGIPGLDRARIGVDSNGRDYPHRYIITSPNMT